MIKVPERLWHDAVEVFGESHQLDKVIEECLELALAIIHRRDGKCSLDDFIDEAADVSIMVDQLVYLIGEDAVEEAKKKKIGKFQDCITKKKAGIKLNKRID